MLSSLACLLADAPLGGVLVALNVFILFVLVVLSGVFSGSETVLFSLTRTQLEHAAASHNPFRRQADALMRHPKQTLMTILVGNTSVNVALFAVSYVFFGRLAEQYGAWVQPVAAVASVLLVVIGGEVVPKVLGVSLAEWLAPVSATVVRVAGVVATPVGRLIDFLIAEPIVRVVFGRGWPEGHDADLSRRELKTLLEMSRAGGAIDTQEDTFLRAIIDLENMRVRDVMVPRVEMEAYDINKPAEGLRELIRATRFKKIPVYDESPDDIVGLVYAKVLFFNPEKPLRELVTPARFVPEVATCEDLLRHFRETRSQLAIVVDEYGGVAGLVTLEDVLENIVGEIHDADDGPEAPEIRGLDGGDYEISGQLSVRYWGEALGIPALAQRVATVGGLVVARLGRPARVGDVVRVGNVELRVTHLGRRRIDRLRLRLLGEDGSAGGER